MVIYSFAHFVGQPSRCLVSSAHHAFVEHMLSTNAQIEVLMYRSPLHYALAPYALAPCVLRAMRPCAMRPQAIRPRIMIVMGSEHAACPHIPCYSMAYQHSRVSAYMDDTPSRAAQDLVLLAVTLFPIIREIDVLKTMRFSSIHQLI